MNILEIPTHRRIRRRFEQRQRSVAHDDEQPVVEVVSNAAREESKALQSLHPVHTGLDALSLRFCAPLRRLTKDLNDAVQRPSARIAHQRHCHDRVNHVAIRADVTLLGSKLHSRAEVTRPQRYAGASLRRVGQFGEALALQHPRLVAEDMRQSAIGAEHVAVERDQRHTAGRKLEGEAKLLAGLA